MSVYTGKFRPLITGAEPVIASVRNQDRDRFFALVMFGALVAFELFNFSTTEFALGDMLGDLSLGPARWAMVLALAFSAMDFAGLAWLLSPKKQVRAEVWYLVGAWLLAATMNAVLTWWSVSLALLDHPVLGNEILNRESLLTTAPIFVACLVWLLRVLLIGTFTLAGRRDSGQEAQPRAAQRPAESSANRNGPPRSDTKGTLIAQSIAQR